MDEKQKQGESEEDAPRCPPHPGFVLGCCSLCGAKEEAAAEGGAPAVAVGHETMKRRGDGDGDGDDNEDDDDEDAGGSASGGGVTVTVAYTHGEGPELPALEAATSIVSASDRATLMSERKLILVLDLDHTLLNSTRLQDLSPDEQANGLTPDTFGDPLNDLFRLHLDSGEPDDKLIKLRPFVGDFLEQASAMFEMHVYTLGNRRYARATVALLDPNGIYFGGRIVSSDESTRKDAKSLDVIQGAEPITVVIVDDRDDVWPGHLQNLIQVDKYHYFASSTSDYDTPSLAAQDLRHESEDDGSPALALVLDVLTRVHRGFFHGDHADVRDVIAEVRRQVLPECTVAFSFLEQRMEDIAWMLAEELGAVCKKDVDEEVTHIIVEDPAQAAGKAQWARDNDKFLVNPEWLKAACFQWRRPDELAFPVKF